MAKGIAARRKPERRGKALSVRTYAAALPNERRGRFLAIRAAILESVAGVDETMLYRMPTFAKNGSWVAVASQKQYLAVYFCSADLIAGVRSHHPELDCGVGCVRIRDTQHVPIYELREAFVRALSRSPLAAASHGG